VCVCVCVFLCMFLCIRRRWHSSCSDAYLQFIDCTDLIKGIQPWAKGHKCVCVSRGQRNIIVCVSAVGKGT